MSHPGRLRDDGSFALPPANHSPHSNYVTPEKKVGRQQARRTVTQDIDWHVDDQLLEDIEMITLWCGVLMNSHSSMAT